MIDTVTGAERNLRNIRQIGTPSDEDKIYIEDAAYQRVHAEEYASKRVFVLMGHTECEQGKYTTFVEAAIPVREIEFVQNLPQWKNRAWSDVFREIKRAYENSIIVGWALDLKGFTPRMSMELEEIHREQFGGAHQVLLLMDSLENEEYFFINKGNRLQKRDGFYIYYSPQGGIQQPDVMVELPEASHRRYRWEQEALRREQWQEEEAYARRQSASRTEEQQASAMEKGPAEEPNGARYRAAMQQESPQSKRKASSYAMAAAIVLLVGILGVGIYQDRIHLPGIQEAISAMSDAQRKGSDAEVLVGTELSENAGNAQNANTDQETLNLIPVEELPSGEIRHADDTQDGAPDKEADQSAGADAKQNDDGVEANNDERADDENPSDSDGQADNAEETDNVADKNNDNDSDDARETSANTEEYYIVKAGDTLTAICNRIYGSTEKMSELVEKNGLTDSDDIRVGQKLLLP